jgi:hypothetical protein
MPSFTKRDGPPMFCAGEVCRLFGFSYAVIGNWITRGQLQATSSGSGSGKTRHMVAPEALLAFVRGYPNLYDPAAIQDDLLRAEALRVDQADPLVPLESLADEAKLPLKTIQRLAIQGAFPIVRRSQPGKRGWGPVSVRRSQMPGVLKALKDAAAANRSALDALHALLEKPAPVEEKPVVKTLGTGYVPNGATDWRGQPLPPRAPQPRCERCGGRLLEGEDEETHQRQRGCLACGHTQAAGSADPIAERQQQDLERARAEQDTIRRGRPSKALTR